MVINVCEKIECPWYQPETNGFGCQAYAVALHWHLYSKHKSKLPQTTQFALYVNEGETPVLEVFKEENDYFWENSPRYQEDREFIESHPDWPKEFPKSIQPAIKTSISEEYKQ